MAQCGERLRLEDALRSSLHEVMECSRGIREAIDADTLADVPKLDQRLELAVGEKERALAALGQHKKDHGC